MSDKKSRPAFGIIEKLPFSGFPDGEITLAMSNRLYVKASVYNGCTTAQYIVKVEDGKIKPYAKQCEYPVDYRRLVKKLMNHIKKSITPHYLFDELTKAEIDEMGKIAGEL